MSQSLVCNYIHITFSTKNREKIIRNDIQSELFNYLGGICKNLECCPLRIGGYSDHIHILCMLSKKIALVTLIEELKKSSSKWIKTKDKFYKNFYWQNGYGAFSVNPAQTDVVMDYIANQDLHHSKITFQQEYKAFLKKYKIEFDERYVWD
jgi:putative transposase